jgi:superfamily II DNA or RNA helicase
MSIAELQFKILTRQTKPGDYDVYRAGLEWDLTDPIVIESSEDFKSTPRWRERLTPYRHQITNLITFCRRLPVTLLADDVGLGKTISAGLIMSELIVRSRLSKTLIVCPKLLCPQWKRELDDKFDIPAEVATGRALLSADPNGVGAVITTYNSARLYLANLPEDRFQMLILDEAHKLRNLYGVPDTPQVATRFQQALAARRFRFVLMLTATPIQNRLWDLYSIVDLLTTARGHENPFGQPGVFARRFIADDKNKARQLKADAREEFRSIVYGYMSRVRRGDAELSFPERKVQMHQVKPTPEELQLIQAIAKPIQKMNKLAQIGILQALVSSPDALRAQLDNMARKGTAPPELAATVREIVAKMPQSAKVRSLGALIEQLKRQNPDRWRLIVFTTRRETQTTIQSFLAGKGLSVGIINGDSGQRNQETIKGFWQTPPRYRVIVSTEAGSEGVNLQVANILVNYDLPWNPMIVEQRIGRVQRLNSDHRHVSIFNMTLQGTFEEYIVGRLMEKLQMAAHAIGDLEALLQGSEIADDEEDSATSFEDRILRLVLDALAGKNVEEAVRLQTKSIEDAKRELEREEANINQILGGMDGSAYVGPRVPNLPAPIRSMEPQPFTLAALTMLGAKVSEAERGIYLVQEKDGCSRIRFDENVANDQHVTLYGPQTPAFQRLVKRSIASGVHHVQDADKSPAAETAKIAQQWVAQFGAKLKETRISSVTRSFSGTALVRVRATVAHDSYERLVACPCHGSDHRRSSQGADGFAPLERTIRDPGTVGLDTTKLMEIDEGDEAITEFSRFYRERREEEMARAGDDKRKRKKLDDDFTPRFDMTVVGLEGDVRRDVRVKLSYGFASGGDYESEINVRPASGTTLEKPDTGLCVKTAQIAPKECLAACAVTGATVLKHFLVKSDFSERAALPEFMDRCEFSGKRALTDELVVSDVTGKRVARSLLKTSAVSGKRAEPDQFAACAFTKADALKSELAVSEISGKPYRIDQQARSAVSGKAGHAQEIVSCHETRQPLAKSEAETCEVSGRLVRPGVLAPCAVTGKRVLPSMLATCEATGKRVLADRLVSSSVSNLRLLRDLALHSTAGRFCLPLRGPALYMERPQGAP